MPFIQREIIPSSLGRKPKTSENRILVTDNNDSTSDDIYGRYMKIHQSNLTESNDEMANRIMTNMIKQLASLGRHANDIFVGLEKEAEFIQSRMLALEPRIEILSNEVEVAMEEVTTVTMNDIMNDRDMKKGEGLDGMVWRSTYENTAGFFTKNSRPETITSLYEKCDTIPNVLLMQEFRDDDKSCDKLYSDPNMFFEIWKSEFMKKMDTDNLKRMERKKTRKAQGRSKTGPKSKIITHVDKERQKAIDRGLIILPVPKKEHKSSIEEVDGWPDPPENVEVQYNDDTYEKISFNSSTENIDYNDLKNKSSPKNAYYHENIQEFDLPPPHFSVDFDQLKPVTSCQDHDDFDDLPPTPSPPPLDEITCGPNISGGAPPPPPPPPPPQPPLGTSVTINKKDVPSQKVELRKSTSPVIKIGNERSDLLKQIEAGKKLRPIELKKRQSQVPTPKNASNVSEVIQSYMETRFTAMGGGSSDEDDNSTTDSNEWSDA